MKTIQEAYIVSATRSPVGKSGRGSLSTTRPDDLLAAVLRSLISRTPKLDPHAVEDAIIGCALPEAQQGFNVARIALLLAGLPNTVGGMTVNRFCSSGLNAISIAADRIRTGESDVVIAGGVESMSMVPMSGNSPSLSPDIFLNDENIGIAYGMGLTAEMVAKRWQVSREDQDAFALASHQKALAAQARGAFTAEITPVSVTQRVANIDKGIVESYPVNISKDDGPRVDTSLESLGKLPSVFAKKGSVTAGNSSQTSDGAGALLLMSEKALRTFNIVPLAKFVSFAVRGVAPEIMGIGPKEAIPAALSLAGLRQDQVDWVELNEAFAAQSLAVIRDLDLDPVKVNPLGSAIALGHPLGATGAIRSTTIIHAMQAENFKYGMVTMCIGTGMGAAGIFEKV